MSSYSFHEFFNHKRRSDVFAFLDSRPGTIDESVLQELYANFGDDDVVNEAWGDWLSKAKGMAQNVAAGAANVAAGAVKGAKEFGKGFVQGSQQGYKDTRNDAGVKKIENIAASIGELSKKFTQKYKIDPVTAAIMIGSGATGGLGTIPMLAMAVGLRKGSAWLAGKGMDAAWKKATGKTPAELDQMWQSKISDTKAPATAAPAPAAQARPATPQPAPAAMARPAAPQPAPAAARPAAPDSDQFHYETFNRSKTSFAAFLENKDAGLYQNIIDEGMWDSAKGFFTGALNKGADVARGYAKDIEDQGFARATGSLVGKGAGKAAGTFSNSVIVFAKSLQNAGSFMVNNPVKTGTMLMAIAAGSMIGSYGTQAINSFIDKPSADQIQDLTAAAKQAGVPDGEIQSMHRDSGYSGIGGDFDTSSSGSGGDFGAKDTSYSGAGGDFGDAVAAKKLTADELAKLHTGDGTRNVLGKYKDWQPSAAGDSVGHTIDHGEKISAAGEKLDRYNNPVGTTYSPSGSSATAPGAGEYLPKDGSGAKLGKDIFGSPIDPTKAGTLPNGYTPYAGGPDSPNAGDFVPKDPNYKGLYSATPKLNDLDGTTMPRLDGQTFDGKTWSGGKMSIPTHRGG